MRKSEEGDAQSRSRCMSVSKPSYSEVRNSGLRAQSGLPQTSLEIYAEEELEHRLNRFMDFLVYHHVRGYEAALRNPRHKTQDAIVR